MQGERHYIQITVNNYYAALYVVIYTIYIYMYIYTINYNIAQIIVIQHKYVYITYKDICIHI